MTASNARVPREARAPAPDTLPARVASRQSLAAPASLVAAHATAALALVLVAALPADGHEGPHGDPELLGHWRAQVHLLFQWAHLVAFGLWVGGMPAATRVPALSLETLLFASWGLFLVSLGTGSYNMEFSAATPEAPDILSLPGLQGRWEFGDAYVVLVGVKRALLVLAVLWTATVTGAHLRRPPEPGRERLRSRFLGGSIALGLALAAVAAMILVLHEAVDLAPTPLHSLGGVAGAMGPDELAVANAAARAAPAPYRGDTRDALAGFQLFAIPTVAGDTVVRFGHMLGFALWLGGVAASLVAPPGDAGRVLPLLWFGLGVQAVTGVYQVLSWTPFTVVPYPWRLSAMSDFRFGYTYTLLLAVKLALALLAAAGTATLAIVANRRASHRPATVRALGWINLFIGLALAYVAVALLLVHEGVDHAL